MRRCGRDLNAEARDVIAGFSWQFDIVSGLLEELGAEH
ncbi:hypothetical protein EKH55_0590 [Sinorhizobium alkalisoli]|nr:hypothetical protein EKH55_0590 [Sinorhizobium alkalisoli]